MHSFDHTASIHEKMRAKRWKFILGIIIAAVTALGTFIVVNALTGCDWIQEQIEERIPEVNLGSLLNPGGYDFDGDWDGWENIWEVASRNDETVVFEGRDGYVAYLDEDAQEWTDYNVDAELEVLGDFDNFGIAVRVEHQGRTCGGRYPHTPALDFVNINLCRVGNTITGGPGDRIIIHGPMTDEHPQIGIWGGETEPRRWTDAEYHVSNPERLYKPPTVYEVPQKAHIYVECRGNRIRVQVNGSMVADVIDDDIPSKGGIAILGARRGGTCTVRIHRLRVEREGIVDLPERGW